MKILFNHNKDRPIGRLEYHNGSIFLVFNKDAKITLRMLKESVGGLDFQVIESFEAKTHLDVATDDDVFVLSAKILEFSILSGGE